MKRSWRWALLSGVMLFSGCQAASGPSSAALPGPEAEAKAARAETVTHDVAIRNFAYDPATLSIRVNESVRWTNYDEAPHDAVPLAGSWKTPLLKRDEAASQVFSEPGVYPYYCTIHPAMRGTVEVSE